MIFFAVAICLVMYVAQGVTLIVTLVVTTLHHINHTTYIANPMPRRQSLFNRSFGLVSAKTFYKLEN